MINDLREIEKIMYDNRENQKSDKCFNFLKKVYTPAIVQHILINQEANKHNRNYRLDKSVDLSSGKMLFLLGDTFKYLESKKVKSFLKSL